MELNFDKVIVDLIEERRSWETITGYSCFWSGQDNPIGFRLTPKVDLRRVWLKLQINHNLSGFPGIAHGGVAFTILDGLMGWLIISHLGRAGFTTSASINYFSPLRVGKEYILEATPISGEALSEKRVSLVGRVLDPNCPEQPLLEMKADFLLPRRTLAEKILGYGLDPISSKMFPDD